MLNLLAIFSNIYKLFNDQVYIIYSNGWVCMAVVYSSLHTSYVQYIRSRLNCMTFFSIIGI